MKIFLTFLILLLASGLYGGSVLVRKGASGKLKELFFSASFRDVTQSDRELLLKHISKVDIQASPMRKMEVMKQHQSPAYTTKVKPEEWWN